MVDRKDWDLSRRELMKMGLALGAGSALGGLLPGSARAQGVTLDWWWWGEQELPGLQKVVDGAVAAYKDATVKPMLQDTAVVISQFQTAAAAGNAPDIQYLWNGIYHMESVWFGYLKGLKELIKPEILTASNADQAQQFRRRYLARRLVSAADAVDLQQEAVRAGQARSRTRRPRPGTSCSTTCEALKTAGIEPLGGGIQDGYWSEWYISHSLPQNLDSLGEAVELFIGDKDFRRSEIPRALGEARGAEDARLPQQGHVVAGTLSRHRPRARRQARHGPVDRHAPAGRPARPRTARSASW